MYPDVESVPALITVAARVENENELDALLQTLASLRATQPESTVLVVDDRSPAPFEELIELAASELGCASVVQQGAAGRSAAFNVGLSVALDQGLDVCLVTSGVVLESAGWLTRLTARTGIAGTPAAIAGGAVVEPDGLIRHAGYFFSLFRRTWSSRLGRVPEEVLDVDQPLLCPVGAELQFVRCEWIEKVGLYDELLDGRCAALDYCLRVSAAGGECVLEPTVRARALTPAVGEPAELDAGERRLRVKHLGMSFQRWAPEVI